MNLKEVILAAEEKKNAIPHFNVATLDGFWAVVEAAREVGSPLIVGASEGERDFFGEELLPFLVRHIRETTGQEVFSNADHTYSVERAKRAIDLGYDAVIYDGAKLSLEENIKNTREVVSYAQEKGGKTLVEGELGYIGTSSKVLDALPEGVSSENLTTPEDAARFVRETGVDLFAPSVGNIHGILRNVPNPALHPDRIGEIRNAAGVPLVLHGGSGISDQDFKNAIRAGISTIHINTELRIAYTHAIAEHIEKHPDDIAPYKFLSPGKEAMKEVALARIRLFQGNA